MATRAQLNNALRRLGSRWCLHIEALRASSQDYPASAFPDPVSALIDDERRAAFEAQGAALREPLLPHLHLSAARGGGLAPPRGCFWRTRRRAAARPACTAPRSAASLRTVRQIADILGAIMPEVRELDDDETLTYLHGCVSTKRHYVRTPDTPAYLDAFLCDDDFQGGLLPAPGRPVHPHASRCAPTRPASSPGLLDRLNELGVSYRWTCRFMPLDKEDARKAVSAVRKRWFAKRKGVMALLKEAITQRALGAGGSRRRRPRPRTPTPPWPSSAATRPRSATSPRPSR